MQICKHKIPQARNSHADSGIIRGIAPGAPRECMAMEQLTPQAMEQVAAYFQALAEPARLRLLNLLRGGERSVGELAEATGQSAANVSRHLALLARQGLLDRRADGTSVFYAIADPTIYELCDLVCGNVARRFDRIAPQRASLARAARAARARPAVRKAAAG